MSLPQEQTDARSSQGEAADGAAPAYRVILQLPLRVRRLSRSARRSSRVDRCGPHVGPRVDRPRLGLLAARSAALLRRCCCRLCGPALCGRWQSRLARARARRGASARAHAIALDRRVPPATAHGTGGLWSAACAIVARGGGRLSGETLNVGHLGSVWSPGCGLRAHMTA